MDKIKINFFILKFGAFFHTIFVFPILYMADIYANTPMFWAFLVFRSQPAALSPFLPRADFPNVASV